MKTLLAIALFVVFAFTVVCGTTNDTNNPVQIQPEQLLSRHYKIVVETFFGNLKNLAGAKEGESDVQMLIRYFKQNGVDIKNPEVVFFDRENLFVRATAHHQDKIENIVVAIANNIQPSKAY